MKMSVEFSFLSKSIAIEEIHLFGRSTGYCKNIRKSLVVRAINNNTKGIWPIHYHKSVHQWHSRSQAQSPSC